MHKDQFLYTRFKYIGKTIEYILSEVTLSCIFYNDSINSSYIIIEMVMAHINMLFPGNLHVPIIM